MAMALKISPPENQLQKLHEEGCGHEERGKITPGAAASTGHFCLDRCLLLECKLSQKRLVSASFSTAFLEAMVVLATQAPNNHLRND